MSTRSALTVVGAVVGAYFGYPQLGAVVGGLVGGAVDPETIKGPAINEVTVQTQAEGVPRIVPWGTVMCVGNVIQNGPLIKTTESSTQGKGGTSVETPTAYRTFAVAICEGPIAPNGLLRMWEDNKLVVDLRPGSLMLAESHAYLANKFLHTGEESQTPDPFLTFIDTETPAYRGTVYMTFVLENQTARGGSFAQYRFEVARQLNTQTLSTIASTSTGGLGVGNGSPSGPVSPGLGGGSVWSVGGGSSNAGTLGPTTQLANGNLYLANCRFQARGVGMNLTAWLKVNGTVAWSSNVLLSDGQYVLLRAQLNHAPDGSSVEIGFTANASSQGFFNIALNQLATGSHSPYVPSGGSPPLIYPDTDVSFGVISDSGVLYRAGDVNSGGLITPWGPASITVNEGVPTTVGAVLSDIHQRCGIAAGLYDVSEQADALDGFSVGSAGYSGADAINGLRSAYLFDKSDHDGKLWYPKRGKAVVKTLTIDNLTEVPDTSQREQASELPYKLNLKYQHAASGYAVVKATAPGTPTPDRRTTGEVTMETAVVMDEDQAAQLADKIYKITLAEAGGTIELSVPLADGADLADADCIGLSLRGRTRRLRIEQSAFRDWTLKLTARVDRQSAYTSAVTGIPVPLPTLPPSTIVGDTQLAVLDIPARTDSEDDLSVLIAVTGALPPWYGAQVDRSTDGGATYSKVLDISSASIMGVLIDPVAAASPHYTDTTNSVHIQLYRAGQTLDQLTDTQFLSERGGFALQNADGTWEVMQYRDATVNLDNTITLKTLHRGLLNSGASAHLAGARFVLLSTATHLATPASYIGIGVTHQATSTSNSPDNTTNDTTITFAGRSQIEWPVASLSLSRNGSNIISGSWAPCHRFGSDDYPVASINFQGYRVTIVGSSTVVLPDQTGTTFTYDASALGASVTVSVQALNRITGAGPATSGTI